MKRRDSTQALQEDPTKHLLSDPWSKPKSEDRRGMEAVKKSVQESVEEVKSFNGGAALLNLEKEKKGDSAQVFVMFDTDEEQEIM